jgi:hypothetical protein
MAGARLGMRATRPGCAVSSRSGMEPAFSSAEQAGAAERQARAHWCWCNLIEPAGLAFAQLLPAVTANPGGLGAGTQRAGGYLAAG